MKEKYQSLVNQTIPVSKALGWHIQTLSDKKIVTQTQLLPNINIHGTVFAGSIFAAAMATGWTLLKCWSDKLPFHTDLVAAEANIQYLLPVTGDFICESQMDESSEAHGKLLERFKQSRNGSLPQIVEIKCGQSICAILKIQFVFKYNPSSPD